METEMNSADSLSRKRIRRLFGCFALFLLLCAVPSAAAAIFAYRNVSQTRPTLPHVAIVEPVDGSSFVRFQPALVLAQAQDPDGIARIEVMVNGQIVSTVINPDNGGAAPMTVSESWRPMGEGTWSIRVRAYDTQGYAGESATVLVASVRKPPHDPNSILQVIVPPGYSLERVAAEFGTTPEQVMALNSGLVVEPLQSGEALAVPFPQRSVPSDDGLMPDTLMPKRTLPFQPGEFVEIRQPEALALSATLPRSLQPRIPALWEGIGRICFLLPEVCTARDSAMQMPRAPRCVFYPIECFDQAHIQDGEIVPPAAPLGLDDLKVPQWIEFFCLVTPGWVGCPDIPHARPNLPRAPRKIAARVVDCRVKLQWSDDSRTEEGFNIYRAQPDARGARLVASTAADATVTVDQPRAPGRYLYYVQAVNYDGSNVSGVTEIEFPPTCVGSPTANAAPPPIPVPANLRAATTWFDCARRDSIMRACAAVNGPALEWDWSLPAAAAPRGFVVYRRLPAERSPRAYFFAGYPARSAPLNVRRSDCVQVAFYSVQAQLDAPGATLLSAPSQEVELHQTCQPFLSVELVGLETRLVDDGCANRSCTRRDSSVEAYGTLWIDDARLDWNAPCQIGITRDCAKSSLPPQQTAIPAGSERLWRDLWLSVVGASEPPSGFRLYNNRIVLRRGAVTAPNVLPEAPFRLAFIFWDHDVTGNDDVWCYQEDFTLPSATAAALAQSDQTLQVTGKTGSGSCSVILRLHRVQ